MQSILSSFFLHQEKLHRVSMAAVPNRQKKDKAALPDLPNVWRLGTKCEDVSTYTRKL